MQYIAASALLALTKDQKRLQDIAADAGAIQVIVTPQPPAAMHCPGWMGGKLMAELCGIQPT